ncbi:transposable element Tcb1 transposase [Trichonephila clavipes]|nr:transposable element Tcb1 transposase [Trichonephila clavipes]
MALSDSLPQINLGVRVRPRGSPQMVGVSGRAEVDMPIRRFRRQYEHERGRIFHMMEAGRVACQLGRSDCVVISVSQRCHLHEDRGPLCLLEPYEGGLAEGHLESWCPLRVLPLTPPFGVVPRTRKMDCSRMEPHTQVVYSYEFRFNLSSDDNRVHVWRPPQCRLS